MMKTSTRLLPRKLAAGHGARHHKHSAEVRLKIRELVQEIRAVVSITRTEEFADLLRQLADNSDAIRDAFIAWVRLIEVVVEECERNDPRPGQGRRKKREVKKTMAYILRSYFDFPEIPDYVERLIIEFAVDWTIDAVVTLVNENDEFGNTTRQFPSRWERIRLGARSALLEFLNLFEPIGQFFLGIIIWVREVNNYGTLPDLRLLDAAERVNEANLKLPIEGVVNFGLDFKRFVGHNSDGIQAMVRLVSGAVKEAQTLRDMTNAQRYDYAYDLIEGTLEELDLIPSIPFIRLLLPYIIDFLIEASYRVLKDRVFNA